MNRWFKISCVVGLLLPVVGCAPSAPSAGSGSGTAAAGPVKIGLSMDSLESGFWVATEKAIKAEAQKENVELVEVMAEGDANKQNQQCDNMIAQGVKAIMIAPKDGAAIEACVKKAKDAGVYTVLINRPVQGDAKPDVQILSDNYAMAKAEVQWFADRARKAGKTYKALVLIGSLGDENAAQRKKGHLEATDANKDVIEVVAQVPTEWKHEVALAGMQNALQAHPEINLVITPSDFLYPPIKTSLTQVNKWAKIGEASHMEILSFDGDETGMKMLKEGYSEADSAQAADKAGEQSVQWAVKLVKGEKPAQVDMLDAGVLATVDNCATVCPTVWGWKA